MLVSQFNLDKFPKKVASSNPSFARLTLILQLLRCVLLLWIMVPGKCTHSDTQQTILFFHFAYNYVDVVMSVETRFISSWACDPWWPKLRSVLHHVITQSRSCKPKKVANLSPTLLNKTLYWWNWVVHSCSLDTKDHLNFSYVLKFWCTTFTQLKWTIYWFDHQVSLMFIF